MAWRRSSTPEAAEIMDIVRALRVTSKSTGDTEIRSDGTTTIAFHADTQIRGSKSGEVELPSYVTIRVPVLKGSDVDSVVTLNIRLRTSVEADEPALVPAVGARPRGGAQRHIQGRRPEGSVGVER